MRCVSLLVTLVILTMCFAWTANALDKKGLVMYLPMDEGSGKVAKDASGNGNNGELMGNSEWVEGQYGQAVHLHQASDEWVEIPHSDSLDITSEITLELWAKVVTMGSHCAFISKATNDQTGSYILHISNDNGFYTALIVFIGTQGPWPPPAIGNTTMGEWHHFAGSYDGAELSIYVDGELMSKANRSTTGDIDQSGNVVVIGRDNRADYWTSRTMDCLLDEVRIWNRVLSQEEIQEAMKGALLPVNSQSLLTTMWGLVKTEL
ncbi:LamG domain-containing protein [Candidatus Poribacteria bacterium]